MKKKFGYFLQTILTGLIFYGIWIHYNISVIQSYSLDELFGFFVVNKFSYANIIMNHVEATHPKGFYLLFKLLLDVFGEIQNVRLVFFGIFILSIVLIFFLFKKRYGKLGGLVASVIWIYSFNLTDLSYVLRMYNFGIFCSVASVYLLFNFLEKDKLKIKKLVFLLACNLIGFCFVYGFIYLVFVESLYLIFVYFKKIKQEKIWLYLVLEFLVMGVWLLIKNFFNKSEIENLLSWVDKANMMRLILYTLSFLGIDPQSFVYSFEDLYLIVGGIFLFCFFVYKFNVLKNKWLMLFFMSLSTYLLMFGFSIVFDKPFFHQDQFFALLTLSTICLIGLINDMLYLNDCNKIFGLVILMLFLIFNYNKINKNLVKNVYRDYDESMNNIFDTLNYNYEAYFIRNDLPFIYYQCGLGRNDDKERLKLCKKKTGFGVFDNFSGLKNLDGEYLVRVVSYRVDEFESLDFLNCKKYEDYYSFYLCTGSNEVGVD